jgi:hypothetical protein
LIVPVGGVISTKSSLFVAAIAFLSIWTTAVALPGLTFSSGSFRGGDAAANPNAAIVARDVFLGIGSVLLLVSLGIAGFLARSFLGLRRRKDDNQLEIEREKPKASWTGFVILLLAAISLVLVVRWALTEQSRAGGNVAGIVQSSSELHSVSSARATRPHVAELPNWFLMTGFGVLLIAVVVLLFLVLLSRSTSRAHRVQKIEGSGQETAERLTQGADLSDPVVACYRDMCASLADRLRIQAPMTPREFADLLAETGFPIRHVIVLTLLFERVRYGHETPGEQERAQAQEALGAIRFEANGTA